MTRLYEGTKIGPPRRSTIQGKSANRLPALHDPFAGGSNIDTADPRTTLGSRFHAERIANEHAEVVRRLHRLERFGSTVTTAIGRVRC
jgi:hypothetical protein